MESQGPSWKPAEFLESLGADAPCGPAIFPDLGLLSQQYEMACGAWWSKAFNGLEVEAPAWADLARQWREALAKSRDLQLAIPLVICELNLAGWPAFVLGVELLHGLIDRFWDGLYPIKQEPRRNRLAALGRPPGDGADRIHFCDQVLELQVLEATPPLTFREIIIAAGVQVGARPGLAARTLSEIKGIIAATPLERRTDLITQCDRTASLLTEIDAKFEAQWGGPLSPKLAESPLVGFLQSLAGLFRESTPAGPDPAAAVTTPAAAGGAAAPQAVFTDWRTAMSIRSEEDVRFALEACHRWYESNYRASVVREFLAVTQKLIGRTHTEIRQMVNDDIWGKVQQVKDPETPG